MLQAMAPERVGVASAPAPAPAVAWVAPFVPGAVHAVSTIVVGFPFDTVKTRLQVGMHSSSWQCLKATVGREGPLALYRGSLMPFVALSVKRPFEFAAFEWCNSQFGAKSKAPFLGGFVAGVISASLGCPFNVMKVQMQTNRKDVYWHAFQVCGDVWRSRGILGFYRGYVASLIMSVPSTTFYLGVYGYLREHMPASRWNTIFTSMVASLLMWTCLLPLDTVRTVIQAQSFKGKPRVTQWWAQAVELRRARGMFGFWRGWTAVAMRAPIMSAASMLAYEHARSFTDAVRVDAR